MRILAIDYGTKNVGLACSDELCLIVQPIESIPNRGKKHLLERLALTVETYQVGTVVIGLPLNMDGSSGDSVERVGRFMKALGKTLSIPLLSVDERLSTAEAMDIWLGMTSRQKKKYRTVDSLAAAMILKRYLEEV